MKRSELEKFLGKRVTVTLNNGDVITGELHKTGNGYPDMYTPANYYFCKPITNISFSCSSIKKLREEK